MNTNISGITALLGWAGLAVCAVSFISIGSYVDTKGFLHEPFYLIPIGWLCFAVAVVSSLVFLVKTITNNTDTHHAINYIELAGGDMEKTKQFYADLCGWTFIDYGPEYAAIEGAGIDGGFDCALEPNPHTNVILCSSDLEASLEKVVALGGEVTIEVFDFPGGSRFHFRDPAGNHLAIWAKE